MMTRFVAIVFLAVALSRSAASAFQHAFGSRAIGLARGPSSLSPRSFTAFMFVNPAGVELDAPATIQQALNNPTTTLVDVRKLDEIQATGLFNPASAAKNKLHWISAPCTLDSCPLLELCSEALIRDKEAPVVVYCASGKRANKAKEVLKSKGYQQVLNAGGYPTDMQGYK